MQFSNFTEWCQTKTATEISDIKETWTSVFELNILIYDLYLSLCAVSNSVFVSVVSKCLEQTSRAPTSLGILA